MIDGIGQAIAEELGGCLIKALIIGIIMGGILYYLADKFLF